VTKNCDYFAKMYPVLNRDLLLTAAIFHDIGKLKELSTFPENDYTDAGQLLGHIMIGAEWVGDAIKSIDGFPVVLANELKHCILAHHGELEFGSPKKPALVEALALSFADNIDAKMETFRELLVNVPENDTKWQGYNRFMETNFRRTSV
jgi:HD-superfamily hydrolase